MDAFTNLFYSYLSPPLGEAIDNGRGLVTGEPEIDEPLLVEALGSILTELDLLSVVLDELVIGREHVRDSTMGFEVGKI